MINNVVDDITRVSGGVCGRMLLKNFIRYNFGRENKVREGELARDTWVALA